RKNKQNGLAASNITIFIHLVDSSNHHPKMLSHQGGLKYTGSGIKDLFLVIFTQLCNCFISSYSIPKEYDNLLTNKLTKGSVIHWKINEKN
ncbi:hypothetical protein, partial [Halobacillus sp. BBL2006]|uniref:hypothetical protein n=1 Tax=Halobacillus sp. BBL2006 TaxID=1543706 RepID=UPI001E316891